jgi:hypothetical protein
MTVRDSITRTGARTPGAEDYPTSKAAHDRVLTPTQSGITEVTTTCAKGRHKPNISRCMPGAGLSRLVWWKVLPYMPAFQPYRGKPAVRNDREGRGNVGIIRSPVRASTLPNCGGREATRVPTASRSFGHARYCTCSGLQYGTTLLCPDVRDYGESWRVSGPSCQRLQRFHTR